MVLLEALKGAQVELQCTPASGRLRCLGRLSVILVSEVFGIVSMAGFGLRAWRTYRSVPSGVGGVGGGAVRLVRDVRYGERPRNVLDLYLPPTAGPTGGTGMEAVPSAGAPVALFCHGGVWASGEKWHYAPMAVRLAQAGVLVGVLHYTLYPQARSPQMAAELSTALSWAFEHAEEYGGDPTQISALGHSAGAHLWFMALLGRARAARRPPRSGTPQDTPVRADVRMPARFVGMAGVYDIGQHYEYEAGRGVALLSTMARAVAGADFARDGAAPPQPKAFAAQSPARLLALAAGSLPAREPTLAGQALARRIGGAEGALTLEDAARLPPCVLMSSCADVTVPWAESAEMYWRLVDCSVPAEHLVYPQEPSHSDFVTVWRPLRWSGQAKDAPSSGSHADGGGASAEGTAKGTAAADLPAFAQDLVAVLNGRAQVTQAAHKLRGGVRASGDPP
ncbi:hypothetical protein WJX81_007272 [Elliptochloris bilobata]|uniref:protein-S-isoprenylcysteine alpha-carbonyl methylesterase n=1 Tax=Elliptochloris bilobata TaxID=381761 RepID=A0AAW1S4E9_9CHLO